MDNTGRVEQCASVSYWPMVLKECALRYLPPAARMSLRSGFQLTCDTQVVYKLSAGLWRARIVGLVVPTPAALGQLLRRVNPCDVT
jgi:hypothetical protein